MNRKFLLCLVVGVLVVAAALPAIHSLQRGRIAQALLWQANHAEEEGRKADAATFLARYLEFEPRDVETLVRLAELRDQLASTPRQRAGALMLLEKVLRADPQRTQTRRRAVTLAMELGRYPDAIAHLQLLREAAPEDGSLDHLLGLCHEASGQYAEAEKHYEAALRHPPSQLASTVQLASLLRRRLNKPARADEIMDALVSAGPNDFRTYLARARYRRAFRRGGEELRPEYLATLTGGLPAVGTLVAVPWAGLLLCPSEPASAPSGAVNDVARAYRLAPDDADVLLAAAEVAQERRWLDAARRHLQRGCELHARDLRMYQALAWLELWANRPQDALACLQAGLKAIDAPQEQAALRWTLAEVLIQQDKPAEAEAVIAALRKSEYAPANIDYLHARLLVRGKRWGEAARALERIRSRPEISPQVSKQADLLLAQCYEQLDEPDRQLDACNRVLSQDPFVTAARFAKASALSRMGRIDEALLESEQLVKLPDAPAGAALLRARLQVLKARRAPLGERDWKAVDQALAQVRDDSVELPLLRAEALSVQDQLGAAQALLEQERQRRPTQVEVWAALATVIEKQGRAEEALALLDDGQKQLGDRVELRLARAQVWVRSQGKAAAKLLPPLAEKRDHFSPEDQVRLLSGLADACWQIGAKTEATRWWRYLAEQRPQDLRVRAFLFDAALQAGDEKEVAWLLDEFRRIEGNSGTMARLAQARRLIWRARRGDKQGLAEARNLLETVAAQRPTWAVVALCRAEVEDLQGNADQALANYKRAVDMGDRHPYGIGRLAQLLRDRNQVAAANEVFRKLEQENALPSELLRHAAEVAAEANDKERALQLVRRLAPATDHLELLWRGRMLWSLGQQVEAEEMLRQAQRQAPKESDTWLALLRCLAEAGKKDEALALLGQARTALPENTAPLVLGQGYELLQDTKQAQAHYQAALTARPDDPLTLRTVSDFLLRAGPAQEAMPLLRRLTDPRLKAPPRDAAWARRNLALLLAAGGAYRPFQEALALLDQNRQTLGDTPDDQRARAVVLATQKGRRLPGATATARQQAIQLLEALAHRQQARPADQFLLSQLYDAEGDEARAHAVLLKLATAPDPLPLHVAHLVRRLLRPTQGGDAVRLTQLQDARVWADRLKKLDPDSLRTLEIQARVLHAEGRSREYVRLLTPVVLKDEPATQAIRLSFVAALLADLGQQSRKLPADAEKLFQSCVEQRPEEAHRLAGYLARQQRRGEALQCCARAWEKCPPEVAAAASLAALRGGTPTADECQQVENWVTTALKKTPQSLSLLLHLADLRDIQGRYPEAEALYREALKREPGNVVALNNLAWLLALREGNHDEALALVNRAVDQVGPLGELLDTRAVIHLAMKRADLAQQDFVEAIRESPTASRYQFHLAQAHRLANNREAARTALQQARASGLDLKDLHPLERQAYQQLLSELELR